MIRIKFLTIFVAVMVLLAAAPAARAWWLVDQFGGLTEFGPEGQVLGEGSGKDSGDEQGKTKDRKEEFKTEIKPAETKTGMRFSDENRIKTEFRPGENKVDIRRGETRLKLERKDGEIRMKIKDEKTGEERELEIRKGSEEEMRLKEKSKEEELLRIREKEDKNEIRVGSDRGRFVIKRNRVGAVSDFPLSVDLSTNTLSVTTPAGEKQVTILPDQAVANMLSRNVIDKITGDTGEDFAAKVKVAQTDEGILTYELAGEKQERLFGLVPLKFKKTAVVSAETGELVETKQTFRDRILEFISF